MYIITIVALVLAASLGWFAYRLLREERRRADARVAVLTAALDRAEPVGWDAAAGHEQGWPPASRGAGMPAMRPDTPAAAPLMAPSDVPELVFVEDDVRERGAFRSEHDHWADSVNHVPASPEPTVTPIRVGGLLSDVPDARRGDARGLIAVVGVMLVAVLALGYAWWSAAPDERGGATAAVAPAQTPTMPSAVPLQLTALGHEQRRGALVVRGVVRNPIAGSDRANLVANVTLLDAAGGVLGTARAAVMTPVLRPGRDGEFSVQLPAPAGVRRYRVTFLAADGSLVAHADRRAGQP